MCRLAQTVGVQQANTGESDVFRELTMAVSQSLGTGISLLGQNLC
jgi:hypothetical protein